MSIIRKSATAKYGYEMVTDSGVIKEITSKTTDGYLHLPEVVNGRKLISLKVLQDVEEYDLSTLSKTVRAPRDPNKPQTTRESWVDHLTEDEKKVYEELKTKATERMTKAQATSKFIEMAKGFTKEELMAMLGMVEG